ncbi:hypothetical protein QQS21_002307, partial [Conoideocrella luteorostrata]
MEWGLDAARPEHVVDLSRSVAEIETRLIKIGMTARAAGYAFPSITSLILYALATSAASTRNDATAVNASTPPSTSVIKLTQDQLMPVEMALQMVWAIPDEVLLQGDEPTSRWVADNLAGPNIEAVPDVKNRGAFGCFLALGVAIGTTLVPATKLLGLKRAIAAAGGLAKVAKLLTTGEILLQ